MFSMVLLVPDPYHLIRIRIQPYFWYGSGRSGSATLEVTIYCTVSCSLSAGQVLEPSRPKAPSNIPGINKVKGAKFCTVVSFPVHVYNSPLFSRTCVVMASGERAESAAVLPRSTAHQQQTQEDTQILAPASPGRPLYCKVYILSQVCPE